VGCNDGPSRAGYDPWRDLAENWPEIHVRIATMPGDLLGQLRYPVILLRAGTSAAQRRCTLAHELVHLERGIRDCGPWAAREELHVHDEAARRLLPTAVLVQVLRSFAGSRDHAALADLLDVDGDTLRLRLARLTTAERRAITAGLRTASWAAAA
jgi:hypothetical protein